MFQFVSANVEYLLVYSALDNDFAVLYYGTNIDERRNDFHYLDTGYSICLLEKNLL